jgi:1-deoxy-D-xylulose-5-phosphate reductoisomerase
LLPHTYWQVKNIAMGDSRRPISVLGSTGSIGRQTLDVVRAFPDKFRVVALAGRNNVPLLAEQVREFAPDMVVCTGDGPEVERQLSERLPSARRGEQALIGAATHPDAEIVVAATSGLVGVMPTLAAIRCGKTIALANKETLVMAGHLVMPEARRAGVTVLPVDSEHSALWQCLQGEASPEVRRLIITASGGPLRKMPREKMGEVTVEEALAHPTWRMGPKVTIDSATLMNKGLEVIEAHWLFDMPYDRISVVVHPQSVIHSMVEFVDDSIKMQASLPSMHLPIQYALGYPQRLDRAGTLLAQELLWPEVGRLDFEAVDLERFPCLRLALEAGRRGGTATTALVGADEAAVALFLDGQIRLPEIADTVEKVVEAHLYKPDPSLEDVLEASLWAEEEVLRLHGRPVPERITKTGAQS